MNSPTVLLIDDDETIRQSISQTLELADLNVQTFSSAKEVLPLLSTSFNGVVLSDIRMPEMDGLELLDHSLAIDSKLPVILISGHADVSTAVNAIRKGASMEFISEALNHSNLKTTKNYFAGFEDDKKKEFADSLMDFL